MKLNKAIENRWSPKLFSNKKISDEIIELLFEAARWAPSARNEQPWMYYYCKKSDNEKFNKVIDFLDSGNQVWAKNSPLLIISVAKKFYDYKNRTNKNALHDLGAANVSIAIQASEMGLQVHQMGGFDKEGISKFLKLTMENYEPVTIIAVGYPGIPENFSGELIEENKNKRKRKLLNEFVTELNS